MQKGRGYDRSRSRSPQDNRGRHQHRQHQERRQFSPGRRVRERSGSGHSSGHSSYSDHQHQEQQLAITVENGGGATSTIPLKVYQKLNRVQQAIHGNQMDQDFLRQVQNLNQRLLLTSASSVGGVSAVQQFPAGMVSAMQQYSAVGSSGMPVVSQYPAAGTASVPVVQQYSGVGSSGLSVAPQYPAVGIVGMPAVQQYPAAKTTNMPVVQQHPVVVGACDGSSIQETGDTQIVNNQGVYCFNVPAPPSVAPGTAGKKEGVGIVSAPPSVAPGTVARNEGDGMVSTSAGGPEKVTKLVKAKEDDPEVVMLQKVNMTDKAMKEVATLNKKIETESKNRKDAVVRSETILNKKIETECENTYKMLKRDLQETLSNTVKTVLPGIIVNMLTKSVNAVITKHGVEVNESFNVFKKRLDTTFQEYEDIPDKCVNSLVNLENTWQKTFDEVSIISGNYVEDINKTKVVVNELDDRSKKMATELLNANKRFIDSHEDIKGDLKNQMAKLQTIMEKLKITDIVLLDKVNVPAQVEPVAKEELSPSQDPLGLSMIQAGIMAKAPTVLPDLATASDISLQQTFAQCEEVMARK